MGTVSFSGMASGLDTDSIVEALLMNQQNKIDTQYKKKMALTYKQNAWKTMNTKLSDFYSKYVDKMKLQANYASNKATSSSSAISVSATSSAATGTHKFKVNSLATGATANTSSIQAKKDITSATSLADLGMTEYTVIQISKGRNDETVVIDPSETNTLKKLQDKLASVGVEMTIDDNNDKISFTSIDSDDITLKGSVLKKLGLGSNTVSINGGTSVTGNQLGNVTASTTMSQLGITTGTSFKLNGKEIKLTANTTMDEVVSQLKVADKNLNISFDETSKGLLISTKETGTSSFINIEGDKDVLSALGLKQESVMGIDASYEYNGNIYTSASNSISTNGIDITFNEKSTSEITVQVTKDTNGMVSYIKDFVEAYNQLTEDINTALYATSSGYSPYTEAEEEAATDEQKEKREKVLTEEALRNDSNLKTIRDNIRSVLQGTVADNEFESLGAIGITTGNWSEKGKLYLDEEKLKEALQKNPDDVIGLFTSPAGKDANGKSTAGVMQSLDASFKVLKQSIDNVRSYNTYYNDKSMNTELKSIKSKITTYQERYESMKKVYQAKFTAMEKALSSLNSQQSTLSSYFS